MHTDLLHCHIGAVITILVVKMSKTMDAMFRTDAADFCRNSIRFTSLFSHVPFKVAFVIIGHDKSSRGVKNVRVFGCGASIKSKLI